MSDLRLKCTKFAFGWGFSPDPAGGDYSAHPDPWLYLRGGSTSKSEGRGEGERKRGKD